MGSTLSNIGGKVLAKVCSITIIYSIKTKHKVIIVLWGDIDAVHDMQGNIYPTNLGATPTLAGSICRASLRRSQSNGRLSLIRNQSQSRLYVACITRRLSRPGLLASWQMLRDFHREPCSPILLMTFLSINMLR